MSLRPHSHLRLVSGAALATVINLSFAACSPVVRPETTTPPPGAATGGPPEPGGGREGPTGADTEGGGGGDSSDGVPLACIDLEPRVLNVLETNCAKCHGAGSAAQAGIDYILNLDALIENGKVKSGNSAESRIFARMDSADAPMPPLSEMQRPSENDIASVAAWIDQCAGVQSCSDQPFISTNEMLARISSDFNTSPDVSPNSQPFTRYFSFVHLYNAGYCTEEIDIYRNALSKLVNSLSNQTKVVAPVAVDADKLIYRIDIRNYGWDDQSEGKQGFRLSEPSFYFPNDDIAAKPAFRDVWEMIADQDPYTVEYEGDVVEKLKIDMNTKFPVLQGDAFIDSSSRSPLYYDILAIPDTRQQLEKNFKIDLLNDILTEEEDNPNKTARAGFKKSDVSMSARVIERHEFPEASNRAYWISFDFQDNFNQKNIFEHPLDFDFDGGEIIFNLQNGFQAYMLVDKFGKRLNVAPTEIVQDKNQEDRIVRNGISCMGCHSSGMITAQDDIRYQIDLGEGQGTFDVPTIERIQNLYPRREEFKNDLDNDIATFTTAMNKAGVPTESKDEPIVTTFLAFDVDIKLRRAAAELGLTPDDASQLIAKLSPDLRDLTKVDGSTERETFTANFAQSICTLKLGITRACLKNTP